MLLQVDAAGLSDTSPRGQPTLNEFKNSRVRSLTVWVFNLSQEIEDLLPDYFQQLLLQSQIASSLSEYADALTGADYDNSTCIRDQRNKYTQLKLKAIKDYQTCLETQALNISADFTAASENVLKKLQELEKQLVYVSSRCDLRNLYWYLNTFIRSVRDLCSISIHSTMNRKLRRIRDADLMDLYRKSLLMVLNNGKQLDNCVSTSSSSSVGVIKTNIEALSKCTNKWKLPIFGTFVRNNASYLSLLIIFMQQRSNIFS